MSDTDPQYVAAYISRQPILHRVILRLFREPIRKLAAYCAHTSYQRGKLRSAEMHEVIGVLDSIYPSKMKRLHISRPGGGGWMADFRIFGGFLCIYARDKFCIYWSTDATPPTKREGNGRWIIGSYGKWASSKFA